MINDSIHKYIKDNITPKQAEKDVISKRYDDLTKMLKGVNFQSGSFARYTAVTPVNDLDIIWELPENALSKKFSSSQVVSKTINPADLDITDILNELAAELIREYSDKKITVMKIEPQTHAVTVYFGPTEDDFSIDIVPAIPFGNNSYGDTVYWVPETAELSRALRKSKYASKTKVNWVKSDPRGYIKEATKLNEVNESYRHVVKFCKKWKWSLKKRFSEIKFKSFHIEMIIKELFYKNTQLDTVAGVENFFSEIKNYLANPQIKDRANNGKFIDDYLLELSQENKNIIINDGFRVAKLLKEMSDEVSQEAIEEKIKQIFSIMVASQHTTSRIAAPISRPYADAN